MPPWQRRDAHGTPDVGHRNEILHLQLSTTGLIRSVKSMSASTAYPFFVGWALTTAARINLAGGATLPCSSPSGQQERRGRNGGL
jgi:hypothetical protein